MDENMETKTNENEGKVENAGTTNNNNDHNSNTGYNQEVQQVLNSTSTETKQQEYQQKNSVTDKKSNTCGVISFIFAMIGIIMFGLPCGIVATILGIIGVATFKPETQTNRWMAITGLVVGAVEIVVMGLYLAVV